MDAFEGDGGSAYLGRRNVYPLPDSGTPERMRVYVHRKEYTGMRGLAANPEFISLVLIDGKFVLKPPHLKISLQ